MLGREKGRASKHLFKYLNPLPSKPTSCDHFSCQNVKCQNVKRCSEGGFHKLKIFVRLRVWSQMIDVQCKCLSKLSQLTNHRVYQELVYQNEVLKAILTGPNTLSLPSPHVVFAQLFSIRFPRYLAAWNRLITKELQAYISYICKWLTVLDYILAKTCMFFFYLIQTQGTLTIVHTWSPTDSAKYNIEIIMVVLNFLIRRDTNPAWNM